MVIYMQFLEKNYVVFDSNSKIKQRNSLGRIKHTTDNLQKIFGMPLREDDGINKWIFKVDNANFTVYDNKNKKTWHLSTNTYDVDIIKNFLSFLSEVRKLCNSARSAHKSIPDYGSGSYQLKGKIALYRVPPLEPPKNIVIFRKRESKPIRDKYGELVFADFPNFRPNLRPKQVIRAGAFGGTYFRPILSGITGKYYKDKWKEFPKKWFDGLDIDKYVTSIVIRQSVNKYNVKMGGNLDMWESSGWITEIDPYGWFQWYCRFYLGRRSSDDARQINRWLKTCGPKGRFRISLMRAIIEEKGKYNDYEIKPVVRQGIMHWAYELTKKDFNSYSE